MCIWQDSSLSAACRAKNLASTVTANSVMLADNSPKKRAGHLCSQVLSHTLLKDALSNVGLEGLQVRLQHAST